MVSENDLFLKDRKTLKGIMDGRRKYKWRSQQYGDGGFVMRFMQTV